MQRQVPKNYTLIGGGRLARHLAHYFDLKEIEFNVWNRRDDSEDTLDKRCQLTDYVMLLINDDQIDAFIDARPYLKSKQLIHCSGALSSQYAQGCHPLMTFGDELYSLDEYQKIPFICDEGANFSGIFPHLVNPNYQIPLKQKALYHALLVMAGNFPQFLWQAVNREIEQSLQLPIEILQPYLEQSLENFKQNPTALVTGPFGRGDQLTIDKHCDALSCSELAPVYRCFYDWQMANPKTVNGEKV